MITDYICTLNEVVQSTIRSELRSLGTSESDIELAMSSRLCDLEDSIDISDYRQEANYDRGMEIKRTV